MAKPSQRRFQIRGTVQGVGYRFFARRAAERYGIQGFARNLPDGTVEIIGAGNPEALDAFRLELSRGPVEAHVEQVTESEPARIEAFTDFSIRG